MKGEEMAQMMRGKSERFPAEIVSLYDDYLYLKVEGEE